MRVNFLALAAMILVMGIVRMFLNHDPWMGGAAIVLSIVMAVVHFIRVRRFKRFDQTKTFD